MDGKLKRQENLIKQNQRSEEERREIARKGGIASGESRRRKADLRSAMYDIMSMPAPKRVKDLLAKMGYEDLEQTNASAIAATLFSMAIQGDQKALEMVLKYYFDASEDDRKTRESNARIDALKKNGVDISVNSTDGEDGGVVIYLPEIEKDEENTEEDQQDS